MLVDRDNAARSRTKKGCQLSGLDVLYNGRAANSDSDIRIQENVPLSLDFREVPVAGKKGCPMRDDLITVDP